MISDPLEYAKADAECVVAYQKWFSSTFIQKNGFYYDRDEWVRYQRDKRRWAREDPSVVVPIPRGFR